MSTIVVSRELPFSPKKVWKTLADFGGVHRFSAGVEASPINAGTPPTGVGSERNCRLYDGNHIQERITDFVEEERLALEIFDTSMPLERANAMFEVASTQAGCTVTMTMDYVVKFGIVGRAMDAMMMRRMMTRSLGALLAGLDAHLATGEEIGQGWKPAAVAA
jgi:uncharacterized protein YndB with AHSA1/START domain